MPETYLILIETFGNQRYIFSTNKLRDMVGASELIYRTGTRFVEESLREVFGRSFQTAEILKEPALESADSQGVEVILATSGKAMLLATDRDRAKQFVSDWSRRVLKEAPGVDFSGAITDVDLGLDFEDPRSVAKAVREVHRKLEDRRTYRTSPLARFSRLPVVAPCDRSEFPAARVKAWKRGNQSEQARVSVVSDKKIDARDPAQSRFKRELCTSDLKFFGDLDKMESLLGEELEWIAVVHADGNGLGEVFLNFDQWAAQLRNDPNHPWLKAQQQRFGEGISPGRVYIQAYREFSHALNETGITAFQNAAATLPESHRGKNSRGLRALIPLVVGGDDLTVLVSGTLALAFTECYLREFCRLSGSPHEDAKIVTYIAELAKARLGEARFGASAGICITKKHFPFSVAYDIAEELTFSAKLVKAKVNSASAAMDFHIVYDSSITSLEAVRKGLRRKPLRLFAKPFVTSVAGTPADSNWSKNHSWNLFRNAVSAIKATKEMNRDRPALPSSQAHAVRLALHREDHGTLVREWKMLMKAYPDFARQWEPTLGESPFHASEDGEQITVFQDALEASSFIESKPTPGVVATVASKGDNPERL